MTDPEPNPVPSSRSQGLLDDLSRRWGASTTARFNSTLGLGLSGGAWNLPRDTPLIVPPLQQMRLVVNLAPLTRHAFWADGRQRRAAASPVGAFRIAPSEEGGRAEIEGDAFAFAQIYIPTGALTAAGLRRDRARGDVFRDPNFEEVDPLVTGLTQALLGPVAASDSLYADHLSLALLSHLCVRFADTPPRFPSTGGLDRRRRRTAVEALNGSLDRAVSLDALAKASGLSPWHFARAFKASFGVPPHAYLRDLRMKRAMALLSSTPTSITEIALACGYATASAFAAAFVRTTGQTPTHWRRERRLPQAGDN